MKKYLLTFIICVLSAFFLIGCKEDGGDSQLDLISGALPNFSADNISDYYFNLSEIKSKNSFESTLHFDVIDGKAESAGIFVYYIHIDGSEDYDVYGPKTIKENITEFPLNFSFSAQDVVALFDEIDDINSLRENDYILIGNRLKLNDQVTLEYIDEDSLFETKQNNDLNDPTNPMLNYLLDNDFSSLEPSIRTVSVFKDFIKFPIVNHQVFSKIELPNKNTNIISEDILEGENKDIQIQLDVIEQDFEYANILVYYQNKDQISEPKILFENITEFPFSNSIDQQELVGLFDTFNGKREDVGGNDSFIITPNFILEDATQVNVASIDFNSAFDTTQDLDIKETNDFGVQSFTKIPVVPCRSNITSLYSTITEYAFEIDEDENPIYSAPYEYEVSIVDFCDGTYNLSEAYGGYFVFTEEDIFPVTINYHDDKIESTFIDIFGAENTVTGTFNEDGTITTVTTYLYEGYPEFVRTTYTKVN